MLSNTSQLATRALLLLGLEQPAEPMTPRALAARLECSASYLGKTLGLLTKAGILRSVRGARGGVVLERATSDITLLHIVEACQGLLRAPYCLGVESLDGVCGYHAAMKELHDSTMRSLSEWTLTDLMRTPARPCRDSGHNCKMMFQGCERHCGGPEDDT